MRYYLDCEFSDTGRVIDLISIALVAEDGRELYLVSTEFDESLAPPWVREHVLPQLEPRDDGMWRTRAEIRDEILALVGEDPRPAFWANAGAYDFVALVQLIGPLVEVPPGWPYFVRDLRQWADRLGVERLPEQQTEKHHALLDARFTRDLYGFLAAVEERAAGG